MDILRDGTFSFEIPPLELSRGLRPSSHNPRNNKFLTECKGAIGIDGVIQSIDDFSETVIDTALITDGFPFPQIFVFTHVIIVCGETDIYELVGGALDHKLAVAAGVTWTAVDFFDFIYMSNGKVAVVRNYEDKEYVVTTDYPIASALCNFNGQVIVGAPDVELT